MSRFSKDPRRFGQTIEEIQLANQILDELHAASPATITTFIAGNHSARINNRFYDNPDLLSPISSTRNPDEVLANALHLPERGIDFFAYREVLDVGGFLVTHGEAYGMHPSQAELRRYGVSGVSGHCHRNTSFETKNRHGFAKWWSLGGLCQHNMDYRPTNDWNHGVGLLESVTGTDIFQFHQIEIIGGRFVFQGKLYGQDGCIQPHDYRSPHPLYRGLISLTSATIVSLFTMAEQGFGPCLPYFLVIGSGLLLLFGVLGVRWRLGA